MAFIRPVCFIYSGYCQQSPHRPAIAGDAGNGIECRLQIVKGNMAIDHRQLNDTRQFVAKKRRMLALTR